jgi:citrate lyase subunit beta / citryl-CoA lyase
MTLRPRRSVLYMPGSNARALDKAKQLPADALILDLEDSVAPDAKPMAREQVTQAVKGGGYGKRELIIRVNALDTQWGADDIAAAATAGPDGVLLPKVSGPADIEQVTDALRRAGAPEKTKLWAMIETPIGVLHAAQIAATARQAGGRLACFILGLNDLHKETRAEVMPDRLSAIYWLSACITAARAYGIDILDSVFNNFRDQEAYRRECMQGRQLGFDGKTLIHPDQIAAANEVFSPNDAEVATARKIVAAFELPENKGKGVINLDGRMVELLHAEMAKRTVAIADAIAAVR